MPPPSFPPEDAVAKNTDELSDVQVEELQEGAGDGGVASRVDEREQFACEVLEQQRALGSRWQTSGSQQLAGACGGALRDGAFPPVPIDLAGRDHVAGCAGRQGVEQRGLFHP